MRYLTENNKIEGENDVYEKKLLYEKEQQQNNCTGKIWTPWSIFDPTEYGEEV